MKNFIPERIYYEAASLDYPLGRQLIKGYASADIPMFEIANHNNIEQLRKEPNSSFVNMKKYLIIGVRKTHHYSPNHKVSDFIVPYTSSGCSAMCMYCYLVCNYNKCSYLRLFVNREEMLNKLIKTAGSYNEDKVFEIGSNSDLILENTITANLEWTIEEFTKQPKGKLTFPTKFHMIEPLLGLNHENRIIPRVSLNPEPIIRKTEFGTSSLSQRIKAINDLCNAGYPVGILIAPVIFFPDWKALYTELLKQLKTNLCPKAKESVFFEIIFMTYSYVHDKINTDAFPNAVTLFDRSLMTGRGRGKYRYKQTLRDEGERFFRELLNEYFPDNKLLYIV